MLQQFLNDVHIPGTIIQMGGVNNVMHSGIECEEFLKQNEHLNLYFLANVDADSPMKSVEIRTGNAKYPDKNRGSDIDLSKKNYFFLDFDIRKDLEAEGRTDLTDEEIIEYGKTIGEKLNEEERSKNWRYIVFSGNGVHVYYIGEPIDVIQGEFQLGVDHFIGFAERVVGMKGDHACQNPARIARVPTSFNNKKEKKQTKFIAFQDEWFEMSKIYDCAQAAKTKQMKIEFEKTPIDYESDPVIDRINQIPVEDEVKVDYPMWSFDGKNFWAGGENATAAFRDTKGQNLLCGAKESRWFEDKFGTRRGVGTFLYRKLMSGFNKRQTIEYFKKKYDLSDAPTAKKEEEIKFLNLEELLVEAVIENEKADPSQLVTYGYNFLDNELGGILEGELLLLGGIAGTGKTTFAMKVAEKAAKAGKKVVVIALEERAVERARKMILYHANRERKRAGGTQLRMVDYLTGKSKLQPEEETAAFNALKNKNIEYMVTKRMLTIEDMEKVYQKDADLYVIDHLHYFGLDYTSRSKADCIEESMKTLNNLTVNNRTRTILIAHFQKIDESKRPTMTNFKDSMAIAQVAKTVMMLWRDKSSNATIEERETTEFICPKNRIDVQEFTVKTRFDLWTNEYTEDSVKMYGTENSDLAKDNNIL
ncbi:AAA family ATPase [Patescibacteria group bacterium]|nr:AAA family ATPase [Patescibacteria group bacterium]